MSSIIGRRFLEQRASVVKTDSTSGHTRNDWYAQGQAGEDALATLLSPLTDRGYVVLRSVLAPGGRADIDFLLIGPTGVLIVDAKNWSGRVTFEGGTLKQDGRRRDKEIEKLRGRLHDVHCVLADELRLTGFPVIGILCFVGHSFVSRHGTLPGILIGRPESLLAALDQLPVRGSRRDVELLRYAAEQKLSSRRPATTANTPEADRAPALQKDGDLDVLVAKHWQGPGQRRLYVETLEGKPLGHYCYFAQDYRPQELNHLPLVQIAHHASEAQRGRLPSVAADYLTTQPPGVLVAVRWLRKGQSRYYFKRVTADGSVVDVGAFDARRGRVLEASGLNERLLTELGRQVVAGQQA